MNIRAFLNLPLLILLLMLAPACNNDSDAPPEATITIFGSAMLDDSLRLAGASVDLYGEVAGALAAAATGATSVGNWVAGALSAGTTGG